MTDIQRFINYLPEVYQENKFLDNFLRIFEELNFSIQEIIDHVEDYFNPDLAQDNFLPWLASWIALTFDENWTKEKQRVLLHHAAELYCWRGTRRGLLAYLYIYLGKADLRYIYYDDSVQIEEDISQESKNPFHFTITMPEFGLSKDEKERLEDHIFAQKPAHTEFTLVWKQQV